MLDFLEGEVLLINKPLGWTSFDVVKKIKYLLKKKLSVKKIKVGHAGTLDPLATGLLIVCTGKKTKVISSIQDMNKEYTGTIVIGAQTASYDLESSVENEQDISHITEEKLLKAKEPLIGKIMQYPPKFSAKRIDGRRAYTMARKGEDVKMNPNEIIINSFEFIEIDLPEVHFRVNCSKGTYIRSLAHDLGQNLGVGGYLQSLCRTKIGDYCLSDAHTIEEVEQLILRTS